MVAQKRYPPLQLAAKMVSLSLFMAFRSLRSGVFFFALAPAALSACTGDIGDQPSAPPPPDVVVKNVPESPELVSSDGFCVALKNGEKLWSVSPEGHAWIASAGADEFELRVVDPFNPKEEVVATLGLPNVRQLQAWSGSDAAVIAEDGLWRLEELARIQTESPVALASPATLCGNPGTNGFLLAEGDVYERRDEQWWIWDSGVEGENAPSALARYEGECQGNQNVTWLTSADGTLWKLEPAVVSTPVRFDALRQAAATDDMLLVLEEDRMWVGPEPWSVWAFPNGAPKQLSASGGAVWAMSGEQLLRFDGEAFVEVQREGSGVVDEVHAHPGGVWLVSDDEVCHRATAPMIRIQGMRPYSRSLEFDYPFAIQSDDASAVLSASLNGEEIPLLLDSETGWWEGDARLDVAGWHELKLAAAGETPATRNVAVKRLSSVQRSWAEDIQPIYQTNCSDTKCHITGATGNTPDLSTYDAWVTFADNIRQRVVQAKTMPPAANQTQQWGDEPIEVIAQWLEGGLLP